MRYFQMPRLLLLSFSDDYYPRYIKEIFYDVVFSLAFFSTDFLVNDELEHISITEISWFH
jgi:hypothetical protein